MYHDSLNHRFPYFDVFHDHFYEFFFKDKVSDQDCWTKEHNHLQFVCYMLQTDFQENYTSVIDVTNPSFPVLGVIS